MKYSTTIVLLCVVVCSRAGIVPSANKTLCQEHRERELKSTIVAKLVPECDENGDYKPTACYAESVGGKRFCTCFAKNGDIIKSPSQKTVACECIAHKHTATNPQVPGAFVPTCEANGHYSKKQCHDSTGMCWCANPDGTKKTEPKRGELACE